MVRALALLFVLNLMDAVMTATVMQLPGFIELNPLMAYFLDLGLGYFFLFKMGLISGCIGIFMYVWDRHPHTPKIAWASNILYISIVLWNTAMIGYFIYTRDWSSTVEILSS